MSTTTQSGVMRQLPLYKCHKEVFALKIKAIEKANPPTIEELERILNAEPGSDAEAEEVVGAIITPDDDGYAAFPVSRAYCMKHNPEPGGYYVVYKDGYKSFSPAAAFEEGYTLASGQ